MESLNDADVQLARLKKWLDREQRARAESEAIAEKALSELYTKKKEIELLQLITVAANEASTVEQAMRTALDGVCAHTRWPVGHVHLKDSAGVLVSTNLWHLDTPERYKAFQSATEAVTFAPSAGLPGRVLQQRKPAWIVDVTKDANFPRSKAAQDTGLRAGFAFPVLVGEEVAAVMEFFSDEPAEPDDAVLTIMAHVGSQLGRVIERRRSEDALKLASQHKSQFLANMSHELRTPLNAIIGITEMLQEDARDANRDSDSEPLGRVVRAARHLLAVINDILDLSKIEAGKMDLQVGSFAIAPVVQDVVNTVGTLAAKNQNVLKLQCPPEIGSMCADQTRIRQALLNLVSNAAKFTENGTITVSARRAFADATEWIVISVADTGIGLTAEQQGRLFQDFVQADASTTRKYGGTGLGLAISRRFCQMMGGDIAVESEPGRGSTFTIRLPAEGVSPQPPELPKAPSKGPSKSPPPMARTAVPHRAPLILVIDDDDSVREVTTHFLTREGFVVTTASGGQEGLRLARELQPDAITLDIAMPDLDGWTVLAAIKGDPATAAIPVILMTIVDEKNRGYSLGAADYMVKPVEWSGLARVLRNICKSAGRGVLVVDDDDMMRSGLRRALHEDGWKVSEAENGRVALARLAEQRPDVIVVDLLMPEMDGFELLDALRSNAAWRDIPVLVLTAKDLTDDDRVRLNVGIERVLQKRDRQELLREVLDVLDRCIERRRGESVAVS
ncbi:response regulator [Bradyrhizobium mercantei]|uniref:response regulator n=1 Tax=Bradyrhizobium mercantei TaxID=1904807 RepID=UPI000978793D|nr:response regulator [Bradyrhizobium mercantei]